MAASLLRAAAALSSRGLSRRLIGGSSPAAASQSLVAGRELSSRLHNSAPAGRGFWSLSSRTKSSWGEVTTPIHPLLGYFHQPRPFRDDLMEEGLSAGSGSGIWRVPKVPTNIRFAPVNTSAPQLSLDFLDHGVWRYDLVDSHQGLLLLRQRRARDPDILVVCDPVRRVQFVLPQLPLAATAAESKVVGTAILSREGHACFNVVCFTLIADGSPLAWVASIDHDSGVECLWRPLPTCGDDVPFKSSADVSTIEPSYCAHACGDVFWHAYKGDWAVKLDRAKGRFSLLKTPSATPEPLPGLVKLLPGQVLQTPRVDKSWGKFRVGELCDNLCSAGLTPRGQKLRLFVREKVSPSPISHKLPKELWYDWRELRLPDANFTPRDFEGALHSKQAWVSRVLAGGEKKVFICTRRCGQFAFDINSNETIPLITEDKLQFRVPVFPFHSLL